MNNMHNNNTKKTDYQLQLPRKNIDAKKFFADIQRIRELMIKDDPHCFEEEEYYDRAVKK